MYILASATLEFPIHNFDFHIYIYNFYILAHVLIQDTHTYIYIYMCVCVCVCPISIHVPVWYILYIYRYIYIYIFREYKQKLVEMLLFGVVTFSSFLFHSILSLCRDAVKHSVTKKKKKWYSENTIQECDSFPSQVPNFLCQNLAATCTGLW